MLKALMKNNNLWKKLELDEKEDGNFIAALITFDKDCEKEGGAEKLLQV